MSSGFEQLKRLIEQPDGKAVRHEIVVESCRRILANYIAEHETEVIQVLTMLDNALIQHSPMLALFVAHVTIDNLRRANHDKCFAVFNEAAAELAAQIGDCIWSASSSPMEWPIPPSASGTGQQK